MRSNKVHPSVVFASPLLMCLALFASLAQATISTTTTLTSSSNPSVYEQSVTLTATVTATSGGTPTGTVTFKHGSATLTVNLTSGVATAPLPTFDPGSYAFTATYNGSGTDSASTSNTLNQTVTKGTPTITWPNPAAITYETLLSSTQLDATATYMGSSLPGTFVYSPAAGTELTAGSHTLSVTFTPTDTTDFNTAPGSATIIVNQAVPIIAWPTPAAITAQAALSATQLDATASFSGSSVPGTFVYSPASGTMLSAGTDTLSVTFTPTDSTDFTTAPGSVQITVYATNTIIVAINGNDTWSGYLSAPNSPTSPTDGPLASPAEAQIKVRGITGTARNSPITVLIRAGNYYLPLSPTAPGTLLFNNANDSGTSTAGVTWSNYPGDAAPVISGGAPANSDPNTWPGANLGLVWHTTGGGSGLGTTYYATLPTSVNGQTVNPFESLYYKGVRRFRSRIHDSGTQTTLQSIGYYMEPGQTSPTCVSTANTPVSTASSTGGQTTQPLANCNLGTYLRVAGTVAYNGTGSGETCAPGNYIIDSNNTANTKCLDRFVYAPTTAGGDPIPTTSFLNVKGTYSNSGPTPCTPNSSNHYPAGDVEIYLIDSWTVDVARINCIDTSGHVIYLTGNTSGAGNIYNYTGPTVGHRYLIENTLDAFNTAAQTTGQTGIWFLDQSGSSGMVLNYIANSGETPTSDLIVIPQLGGSIPGKPAIDYIGASLIYAPAPSTGAGLSYVTFSGVNFAVDDFYAGASGINNDVNGEYTIPQAIDCESCVSVTFNGITVSQTSGSGILIASPGSTGPAASNDTVEYSVFYDIGSSGIRVGHAPGTATPKDVAGNIVTGASVHDNLVKGYSRVYADGEGIAVGNGNNDSFVNNTITDGYHAGISVCYNQCGPTDSTTHNNVNGNNITAQYNLISNLMQGITSDGGSLYFNVGGQNSSGTGNVIQSNVVYDTSDSTIIDNVTVAKTGTMHSVPGSAYGGEGIYLDAQTANVQVSNNVVYNLDGNAIHISAGVSWSATNASTNETPNVFNNNIFAFADASMLMEQQPWAGEGCPSSNVTEVKLNENIFNFDKPNSNNSAFQVVTGCSNSCGEEYSVYQTFTNNAYYNTVSGFGSDTDAFQVLQNQGASYLGASPAYSCNTGNYFPLSFGGTACSWQEGSSGTLCKNENNTQVALPMTINEDVSGEVYNSAFPATGQATDQPSQYSFGGNHLTGPSTGFTTSLTDTAITNAGRCTTSVPPSGCLADPAPSGVLPTLPNYSYRSF